MAGVAFPIPPLKILQNVIRHPNNISSGGVVYGPREKREWIRGEERGEEKKRASLKKPSKEEGGEEEEGEEEEGGTPPPTTKGINSERVHIVFSIFRSVSSTPFRYKQRVCALHIIVT